MTGYEDVAEELRALAHPLRLAILACVGEGLQEPAVIWRRIVQKEPELQLALVAYHVQRLKDAGLIRMVREEKAGNITRHFYGVTGRGHRLVEALAL